MPGGKVGGVADVVHDLPLALTRLGWRATIVTPAYGMFHTLPGARQTGDVAVRFHGKDEPVAVFEVPGNNDPVCNIVFEHPAFSPQGPGRIYCSDGPLEPFASDARKFALFSAALASWLADSPETPDVLHLHDWHTGLYFLLRDYDPRFAAQRGVRSVFTIHNLAYQGTRPFAGHSSSLESWFPGLSVARESARDPRYPDCVNPMACGIRLADRVSTVSPTYAQEICEPSDPLRGFIGGEALEEDLRTRRDGGHLVGILNGCEYPRRRGRRPAWPKLVGMMREQVGTWRQAAAASEIHDLAGARLAALPGKKPRHILVSIGRLVEQKMSLFLQPLADGRSALEHLLQELGDDGLLVLLGSGNTVLEEQVFDIASHADNLVFLCGYSESLAEPLYRSGNLFLMPSSFEPCGISQMLSLRAGVPCVVHGVGGLRDTIDDGRTGFVFGGNSPAEQAGEFVTTVRRALRCRDSYPDDWQAMRKAASAARFDWKRAARRTVTELYDA